MNTTGVKVNNMQTSLPGSTLSNAGHHVHLVQRVKHRVIRLQTFWIFVACSLMMKSLGFEEDKNVNKLTCQLADHLGRISQLDQCLKY